METNKTNKIIRNVLQYVAMLILIVYAVFRIAIPVINQEPVFLDKNDGWIILGSLAVALTIEAVKKIIARKAEKF